MTTPIHAYVFIDPNKDKRQRSFISLLRVRSTIKSSVTVTKKGVTPRVWVKMDDGKVKILSGEIAVRDFFERYPKQ